MSKGGRWSWVSRFIAIEISPVRGKWDSAITRYASMGRERRKEELSKTRNAKGGAHTGNLKKYNPKKTDQRPKSIPGLRQAKKKEKVPRETWGG